ncbi:MAG: hypothetical protein QX198_13615 [Methylococcaceae bacterium]
MKISMLDRVLLLLTGLLAAYQVAVGINGLGNIPMIAYTVAFGVLLVAGLLIIILGFEILDSPVVVIVSTIIPLSLSLGLVWEHMENWRGLYLGYEIVGFLAILLTRSFSMPGPVLKPGLPRKLPTIILAFVHGIAGLIIFLLPSILAANGTMKPGFALVGLGGALIGIGGLLLSFLKAGKPILPKETILRILPGLLLLMTVAFVTGFSIG